MNVTDEMVERMKSAIEGECDGLSIDDHHAKAILEYVLQTTALSVAPQVKVRDLAWEEDEFGNLHAEHSFFEEFIMSWRDAETGARSYGYNDIEYADVNAAKAAAQADYTARIMSALEDLQVKETAAHSSHEVVDLDYCFSPESWEFTCSWPDRDQVHGYGESLKMGQPMRVCTLLKGPDKWVADVPVTWDQDGEPDETEIKWFDSEEEALAALATEGKDNG